MTESFANASYNKFGIAQAGKVRLVSVGIVQARLDTRQDCNLLEKVGGNPNDKMLNRVGTELWNSQALGQFKMAPPVEQEPSIEYPLSRA